MPETITPAVPPTPPVTLSALLAREDLGLRQIAGPTDPGIVIHWAHTSEMADPYPYLLGGELLLTAGVHIPEGPDGSAYFDDYVSRIVAAGGAALGFGLAPVHDSVPRALVAACESHRLPLLEVPPQTTFSGVARAVWQLMAQARLAELRRVTEAQQSLAAAAARQDPVPSVLRQLAQRLGGRAVLYGPDGTEVAGAGREPTAGAGAGREPAESAGTGREPVEGARTGRKPTAVAAAGRESAESAGTGREAVEGARTGRGAVESARTGRKPTAGAAADREPAESAGTGRKPTAGAAADREPAESAGTGREPVEGTRTGREAVESAGAALAALAGVVRPAARTTTPPDPTDRRPHAPGTPPAPATRPQPATTPPGTRPTPATPPARPQPATTPSAAPGTLPHRPQPTSATDAFGATHLAVYALGAGEGFVLGVATPRREPGDHTIASVAAVLLTLLTGEHQSGAGAARSSALVRLLLGAPPGEVAPLLGSGRWLVVHARPEAQAPDPVAGSALGAALGSPLVDVGGDVVRVLVPADRDPAPQPGWTLGVSAPAEPHEWPAADTQAARALARARATRAPLLRHAARPALADLVPPADAETHARTLLAPLAGQSALTETLRTWLSLHGSWDRTAVALGVHRNTVRQRIARCAGLLAADLDDPDVRMELWFALRRD
ncbi:PucR family transcriptional regulator ligand-binding domain-containing protein [Streptomyces sp. 5-8]|uniref:PucR family transcriptional regulator ligand-binding domain-containing protein n=1 Tax=Streptomyces musisoli TaxID=2802280 RepID=A0ABS1NZT6_9ACTN|nr:PucR family transcriptional regulator ligand-binding domain-containing protein [Streptomyces musisoli]MBL1105191.1 PucR family transcriptional regulator ligand-binding domain-containing protein [Streptomyces musisoli]